MRETLFKSEAFKDSPVGTTPKLLNERENFKQVLISDRLRPILDSQIAAFVNRFGASPRSVQVRELGYRWGSCGHKGDLYFHAPCGDAAAIAH